MKKRYSTVSLLLLVSLLIASASSAVEFTRGASNEPYSETGLGVSVRLIGGDGEILFPGKNIGLSFKANRNSYVVIYNIDSEGFVNLLYPSDGKLRTAEGNKVYTVPERGSDLRLEAGGKTGIEYIHAIAVENRGSIDEQELYFLSKNYQLPREKRFRTDLDPYLAFNMIDESLVEDIEETPPATDHTYFFVNRMVEYPSYLCAECHGADKFTDPYAEQCSEISIEKNYYDTKLDYPYPPLYNIVHVDEVSAEEYYSSATGDDDYYSSTTYYEDNLSNDWDDELFETDETDVHLSISYWNHGYYPYHGYLYPHHGFGYSYWYPSYHYGDSYYWGFGIGWSNWNHYGWYGYYPYYAWHHPYNYWWRDHHYNSRSLYAGRNFRRRTLNYYATLSRNRKEKSLRGSRLARKRIASAVRRRSQDSRLSRSLSSRGSGSARGYVRKTSSNTRTRYNPRTRVIYGDRRGSSVRSGSKRSAGTVDRTRRATRDSRTSYRRDRNYDRKSDNRSVVRPRSGRSDRIIQRKTSGKDKSRSVRKSRDDDSRSRPTRSTRSTQRRKSPEKSSTTTRSRRSSGSSAGKSSRTTRSRGSSGSGRSRSSGRSSGSSSGGSSRRSSGGRGRH